MGNIFSGNPTFEFTLWYLDGDRVLVVKSPEIYRTPQAAYKAGKRHCRHVGNPLVISFEQYNRGRVKHLGVYKVTRNDM